MDISQSALSIFKSEAFNSGWIFLFLFIMFVLIENNVNAKFLDTGIGVVILMTIMCIGGLISLFYFIISISSLPAYLTKYNKETNVTLVKEGEYYIQNCTLVEENINNGFFEENTNKLQCGKTLKNITVNQYNSAINAYKKQKK